MTLLVVWSSGGKNAKVKEELNCNLIIENLSKAFKIGSTKCTFLLHAVLKPCVGHDKNISNDKSSQVAPTLAETNKNIIS